MSVLEKVRSTLGTYGNEDVRHMLKEDHEIIRSLAKDLAEASSAKTARDILVKLKPLLTSHSRAEEIVVYRPLALLSDSPDSRAAGNEGAVEHSLVDIVMSRLDQTPDASTDIWKAHAKVMHELLDHHIKEEEGNVFEELGEHFSDEQREQMGKEFSKLKDQRLDRQRKTRVVRKPA